MKRKGTLFAICLFITSILSNCKKEDSPVIVVDNGTWKVSYFYKNNDDKTAHVSGYVYRFEKGGKVSASSAGGTFKGTWSCACEDGKMEFTINFGSAPLNEMNDEWHIMDQTTKALQLQHVRNGGTDYLTFQKL